MNKQMKHFRFRAADLERWQHAADKLTGGNLTAFLTVAANEKAIQLKPEAKTGDRVDDKNNK